MLSTQNQDMNNKYEAGVSAQHSPLRDAVALIQGETASLETDYLRAVNSSWACLTEIQGVFGGPMTTPNGHSNHRAHQVTAFVYSTVFSFESLFFQLYNLSHLILSLSRLLTILQVESIVVFYPMQKEGCRLLITATGLPTHTSHSPLPKLSSISYPQGGHASTKKPHLMPAMSAI